MAVTYRETPSTGKLCSYYVHSMARFANYRIEQEKQDIQKSGWWENSIFFFKHCYDLGHCSQTYNISLLFIIKILTNIFLFWTEMYSSFIEFTDYKNKLLEFHEGSTSSEALDACPDSCTSPRSCKVRKAVQWPETLTELSLGNSITYFSLNSLNVAFKCKTCLYCK